MKSSVSPQRERSRRKIKRYCISSFLS